MQALFILPSTFHSRISSPLIPISGLSFYLSQDGGDALNKKTTLKLNRDFRRLYYKGSSAVHPLIVTYASKNRLGYNRIGITVTKKIGKAVCRNRCKRIIRAAFAQVNTQIEQGWDFVFVARMKTPQAKSTELEPVLKKQIQSLTRPDKSKANANPAKAKGRSPKKNLPKGQKASEHRGAAREQ